MKSVIWRESPYPPIIDLTHQVPPQNEVNAAFLLNYCFDDLPEQAVLLLVVDPMVGTDRKILSVETTSGRYIVAPDRGLIDGISVERAVSVENHPYDRNKHSTTFHGRDWFAPVGRFLSLGHSMDELGPLIEYESSGSLIPEPDVEPNCIRGEIVHIDHFGNLITNIAPSQIPSGTPKYILINGEQIESFTRTYGNHSGLVGLVGSFERLEIARPGGSAAAVLEADYGTEVELRLE